MKKVYIIKDSQLNKLNNRFDYFRNREAFTSRARALAYIENVIEVNKGKEIHIEEGLSTPPHGCKSDKIFTYYGQSCEGNYYQIRMILEEMIININF